MSGHGTFAAERGAALREGHADAVHTLIAAGADVKALDDHPAEEFFRQYTNGWTPLHFAAMAGNTAIAAILLDHGADANAIDQRGRHTPLHFAAWAGNTDLVTLLLAHKAERDAKDKMNRIPRALAQEKGPARAIRRPTSWPGN